MYHLPIQATYFKLPYHYLYFKVDVDSIKTIKDV